MNKLKIGDSVVTTASHAVFGIISGILDDTSEYVVNPGSKSGKPLL